MDRQRKQCPSGHIHFLAGQFAGFHVHREGIRQLDAEFQALFFRQRRQPLQHRHRVFPLQIFPEVPVVKAHIVKPQAVQPFPGKFIPQQRRVQFDIGVQMFFRDQVGSDPLDFIRRTAVKRGLRDGTRNPGADAPHIGLIDIFESPDISFGPFNALPEGICVLRLDQAVNKGIDLLAFDPGQIIPDRHVKHEGIRISQSVFFRQQLAGYPGFDILCIRFGHIQLRGPFAVVALVPAPLIPRWWARCCPPP